MATLLGTTDTTGGANDFFGPGDASGTRYTATASGTVTDLFMTVRASSTTIQLAIYADASGAQGALLGNTADITYGAAGTFGGSLGAGVAVTSGTAYWLMMWDRGAQNVNMTGGILNGGYDGHAIGTTGAWPDPWNNTGDSGDPTIGMPIRADGTVGGGSTKAPPLRQRFPRALLIR